ncbi:Acetyltransferase [Vibrio crassostreae]|uniref:Acetyltransferase n=1 Tax=Vibrio crassostreae TaxID=246167 RepID=A0A822MZZ1_9VIBR|nr:GNAT family N-acetyltransferase [Vibrio crassostreae]MDH5948964.1 GNAT family N-acetyltransferase [Vibrio crassostreae]TCN11328.1 putative GNAT family N-acyltransferase [Vibrio crassostreae]TCU10804.1 putative GNAT family N-acyltransferase [Vibrio crassostreae]CAK1861943.1 Acetyltransferase [Vibrio crassostreae]CAK1968444.1 Acetyltransferase [Vibrio crassostreae]
MEVVIGNNPELIMKAQSIRHQVFVVEQSIPQILDLDGLDPVSHHALITDEDNLVATARLHIDKSGHSTMARVAVLQPYRGSGIASEIVMVLLKHASEHGAKVIEIHAHQYLKNYYEKFGFEFIREVEIVGEHQLIEMRYNISS